MHSRNAARPPHQRVLVIVGVVLAAAILAGSVLDAISNANALISPGITYVGTVVLLIGYSTLHFVLRRYPLPWVVKGEQIRITGLGGNQLAAVLGLIGILWVPRAADVVRPPDRTDINWADLLWSGEKMTLEIVEELPDHMRQSRLVEGAEYTLWFQREPCIWRSYGPMRQPKDVNGGALVPHHFNKSGTSIETPTPRSLSPLRKLLIAIHRETAEWSY